jgi:hypothetical protein
MKIENRLSTLTNKIKENLSLLGDGCSLLTLVNMTIMTPSETSSEKRNLNTASNMFFIHNLIQKHELF